jgi:hypothetical protein
VKDGKGTGRSPPAPCGDGKRAQSAERSGIAGGESGSGERCGIESLARWGGSAKIFRLLCGRVAQLGERLVRNEEAGGSNPLSSTIFSITYAVFCTRCSGPGWPTGSTNRVPARSAQIQTISMIVEKLRVSLGYVCWCMSQNRCHAPLAPTIVNGGQSGGVFRTPAAYCNHVSSRRTFFQVGFTPVSAGRPIQCSKC